ncbi:O-phosphoseryl-trna selenium transferase, partial [Globisporangium splendens]
MNAKNAQLAEAFVPPTYVEQGLAAIRNREQLFTTLLSQRRVPNDGWDEQTVELVLQSLAAMDSNNFRTNIGAGEREARVFSSLVAKRHFHLCHGVGRSGDVAAVQPKAAGSSLIVQLTNALAKDLLREAGLRSIASALVLPVATGMSLTLVLLALRAQKPDAKYVIWPRIDQKSCFKSILTAGLTPLVLENTLSEDGDQLRTDMDGLQRLIYTHSDILAVLSTTSCFAPRGYDDVEAIARVCQSHNIAHVINNAYGVQASKCTHMVNQAMRVGRVDAIVQSLDKNFMVPVGGAIVCSPSAEMVANVSKCYPGRAAITPTLDFFITMLQMGRKGYRQLLQERKTLAKYLQAQLQIVALEVGERVLHVPFNEISFAMTLSTFSTASDAKTKAKELTFFGAMLFSRGVSGTRVVSCLDSKTIGGYTFQSYGAHSDHFPAPYLTVACAIGMTKDEVDALVAKLRKTIHEWRTKHNHTNSAHAQQES